VENKNVLGIAYSGGTNVTSVDGIPQPVPASEIPSLQPVPKRPRRTLLVVFVAATMLLAAATAVWLATTIRPQGTTNRQFNNSEIDLTNIAQSDFKDNSPLSIVGQLNIEGGFAITPSAQPTGAKAGQIYYDQTGNFLSYFNGTNYVKLTGDLNVGAGLTSSGGVIANNGVLSLQGATGDVTLTAGNGITISGTTISASNGSGLGGTGTAGNIAKFTGASTLADSLLTDNGTTVSVGGNLSVTGGISFTTALSVANGGTGTNSLAANGVLIGNGTGAITSAVAAGAGLCLQSTAGAPAFSACPGGVGAAFVQNGNSFAATAVLGTNDNNGLNFEVNNTTVETISTTGAINFINSANSTQAFNIETSSGGNLFTVDTIHSQVGINLGGNNLPSLGNTSTGLQVNGALSVIGNGSSGWTTFITPQGGPINTKVGVDVQTLGAFDQVLSLGVDSTSDISSRAISLLDARTTAHVPTLAVFSPNEVSAAGITWNGSNTVANVETQDTVNNSSRSIRLKSGDTTASGSSGDVFAGSGDTAGGSGETTGALFLVTGSGSGTNNSSGRVVIDSGSKTGSGTTGVINIGVINASAINIGRGGLTTTNNGSLLVGDLGATNTATYLCYNASGILARCNTSGSGAAFVQGGNSFGATANLGTTDLNGINILVNGTSAESITSAGAVVFRNLSDSTTAFQIQNSAGSGSALTADVVNGRVGINIASDTTPSLFQAGLEVGGALRLDGNSVDHYITPLGSVVVSKVNIVNFDPGAFGQVLALGLANSANSASRVITILDARSPGHQATLAILSPDENQIGGLSWDGTNSDFKVTTTTNSLTLSVNGTSRLTATNTGVSINGVTVLSALGSASNASYLCYNGTNQIAGCSTTATGSAFTQGGNSLGATATLGTSDSNTLNVVTNGGTRLSITSGGAATFQNGSDSTTGFRILNAGGTPQFIVDTVNSRIYIGDSSADGTGALLVLDTKNTAGDPTGTDGAMYYNSALGVSRCYIDGYWRDCVQNTRTAYDYTNDFVKVPAGSTLDDTLTISGEYFAITSGTLEAGHPGILNLAASTNGNKSLLTSGSSFDDSIVFGNSTSWRYEQLVQVDATLSDGTNRYVYTTGFNNATDTIASITNGCFFKYSDNVNSGNWQGTCRSASTESTCDTTTAVAASTWYRLTVVVNDAANSVNFLINGVSKCTITTNIPSTSTTMSFESLMNKTLGNNIRSVNIDYLSVRGQFTASGR